MRMTGATPLALGSLAVMAGAAFLWNVGALPGMVSRNVSAYLVGLVLGWAGHRVAHLRHGAEALFAIATAVLVLVLVIGIELGGVQATTSEINLFAGLGNLPPLPPLSSLPGSTTGSVGTPGTPGTPGSPGSVSNPIPAATSSAAGNPIDDAVDAVSIDGERFGPMFWVGSAGMLMLLGAAEGDRRKMRRAQREIPLEA